MPDYPVKDGNGNDIIPVKQSGKRARSMLLATLAAPVSTQATVETLLASVTIPGGTLGKNGMIRVTSLWSHTNSANNKTMRVKLGSTNFLSTTQTATVSFSDVARTICNRNSEQSQICRPTTVNTGSSTTALATGTIDTSVDQVLGFYGLCANAADTLTLEYFSVEVIVPDAAS